MSKRKLVLHFDVNKTIIMKDSSNSLDSVELTICQILANAVWGKLVQNEKGETEWVLAHDQITEQNPQDVELLTYRKYLDQFWPIKTKFDIHDNQEREKINAPNKKFRNEKLLNFTQPGNPGSAMKDKFDTVHQSLTLPRVILDGELGYVLSFVEPKGEDHPEDEEVKTLTQDQKFMKEVFSNEKYHIVPSFFKTLIYLKKQNRDYSVVFRTFGSDLENLIWEFNKFCTGQHPCYNGQNESTLIKFDGTKGTKDFRIIEKNQKGLFYRHGEQIHECSLVTGTLNRIEANEFPLSEFYSQNIQEGTVKIYQQPLDQVAALNETLKKRPSMAIQDDYEFWKTTNYMKWGGKLLLVDQSDFDTHHIFFDDNAGEEGDCVIDVKDPFVGKTLAYKKTINKYVFKVEPHRAILEHDYFIKLIEIAEEARGHEIQKMKLGFHSDTAEDPSLRTVEESEWQKLQKLPDSEYLLKTVLPVLYQGMNVIDLNRPQAPLEYLALYLLQNQDKITLPPKQP